MKYFKTKKSRVHHSVAAAAAWVMMTDDDDARTHVRTDTIDMVSSFSALCLQFSLQIYVKPDHLASINTVQWESM